MHIGFIGLGIMGRPMAMNLMKGGHHLSVYGRRGITMEPLTEAGAVGSNNPAQAAANSEITFIMVSDTPDNVAGHCQGGVLKDRWTSYRENRFKVQGSKVHGCGLES